MSIGCDVVVVVVFSNVSLTRALSFAVMVKWPMGDGMVRCCCMMVCCFFVL